MATTRHSKWLDARSVVWSTISNGRRLIISAILLMRWMCSVSLIQFWLINWLIDFRHRDICVHVLCALGSDCYIWWTFGREHRYVWEIYMMTLQLCNFVIYFDIKFQAKTWPPWRTSSRARSAVWSSRSSRDNHWRSSARLVLCWFSNRSSSPCATHSGYIIWVSGLF